MFKLVHLPPPLPTPVPIPSYHTGNSLPPGLAGKPAVGLRLKSLIVVCCTLFLGDSDCAGQLACVVLRQRAESHVEKPADGYW